MKEEDFYSLLGQPGIFKRNLRNDWSLEFGTLKKVIKSGDLYLYVSTENQICDNFIPMFKITGDKQNREVPESKNLLTEHVADKNVSDEEFAGLCRQALSQPVGNTNNPTVLSENYVKSFVRTRLSIFKLYAEGFESLDHEYKKYVGKFGVAYNERDVKRDSDKNITGVLGYGLRFVRLAGIMEENDQIKFITRVKSGNYCVRSLYDHFRPFTQEEFNNAKLGIGLNNDLERLPIPRLAVFRYKSDNKNRTVLYKCASKSYERSYDSFYSIKDLSNYVPMAVED